METRLSTCTPSAHQTSLITMLVLSLVLSACSVFGKLSEIEYNNQIVEQINTTSSTIEDTATLYNDNIPDLVTEESSIDTSKTKASYKKAEDSLEESKALLSLEGRNIEQQNAARTELQSYLSAGEAYLESYQKMLDYYDTEAFKTDVDKVESLDETLHKDYTTFIQANNDLVETLDQFVVTGQDAK